MASRDLSHTAGGVLDARAQHRPGGVSLTLRGSLDGFVVDCDGEAITPPMRWEDAAAEYHRLRAARAFAGEALFHTLTKDA